VAEYHRIRSLIPESKNTMNSEKMLTSYMTGIDKQSDDFFCFYINILNFRKCEFLGNVAYRRWPWQGRLKAIEQAARRFLGTYRKGANPHQRIDIDRGVLRFNVCCWIPYLCVRRISYRCKPHFRSRNLTENENSVAIQNLPSQELCPSVLGSET
jgi:hypothetical protein